MHRLPGVALAALLAMTPGSPAAAGLMDQSAAECVDGWRRIGLPADLRAMEPQGAATLRGEPAWVVGLASARAGNRAPMIAAWNGARWTRVASPWTGYGVLKAVAASSARNAWTVGSIGSYTRWPVAGRWNGTSWSKVAVPRPASQMATLVDLALLSPGRLWAVGTSLHDGRLKPLAMLHTNRGWNMRSPVIEAAAEGALADVTVAPDGIAWAAGWRTATDGQGRPWVVRRDASGWRDFALAGIPAGRGAVLDLAIRSASEALAAGFVESDVGGGYLPLLLRWDGATWSALALPWAADRSIILTAVEFDVSGRVTVTGMEVGSLRRDILAVWDGSSWQVASLSAPTDQRVQMMDAAPLAHGALAVGYLADRAITAVACASGTAAGAESTDAAPPRLRGSLHDRTHHAADHGGEEQHATQDGRPGDALVAGAEAVPGARAVDATAAAGLALSFATWGGLVGDFNADGYDDLYVGRHFQLPPLLMLNGPSGTFVEAGGPFTKRDRHRCAAADVDADGTLDVFCTVGVNRGTSNTPQELALAPVDGGGTVATRQFGLLDGFGRGRDAVFLNLDRDAYPDLYVINEPSRSDAMWSGNRLYRNGGGAYFSSAASWGVDHSMSGNCATAGDLDGDGDDELLLCTAERFDGLAQGLRVFFNDGTRLVDRTVALGLQPAGDTDAEVADFNGDGLLDIAQLSWQRLRINLATPSGQFTRGFEVELGGAVAMAVGDVNADGRPDVYVARRATSNAGHLMLLNGGSGTAFKSMAIPQPGSGTVDDVLAIDWDHNGRTDFVTLNGWNSAGPVKLTAFYP